MSFNVISRYARNEVPFEINLNVCIHRRQRMNGYHEVHLMLWAHFQYQTQSISVCGDLYDNTFDRKIVTTKHLVGRLLRHNIWSEDCYAPLTSLRANNT
jgi:hypothetical protein